MPSLHIHRSLTLAGALLGILVPLHAAQGQDERETVDPDPRIQRIDSVLRRAEQNGMNGTILIRADNRVLLHKAYGVVDRETEQPLSTSHGFLIGSLVKPITGIGILKLEERGSLSTDDSLAKYFPDAPPDKRNITVMQILTHTAGMDDLFGGDFQLVSRDWLVNTALNAPLIAQPGEREEYSNSGYSLLAVIIEKVTGLSYEEFVRSEVLAPTGVHRIGYVSPNWQQAELAVGYRSDESRWGIPPYDLAWAEDSPSWNLRGNGGMLGTPAEMAQWYEAVFDGEVLGPAALDKWYGYAAGESRSVGGQALAHAGGNGIFNAFQVSFIEKDVHLTFFTSTGNHEAEFVWRDFRDDLISFAKEQ